MSKTNTFRTPFRRRAEGSTNYVKRMAFMKSGKPRAVIRKSTNNLGVQFVRTEKGKDSIMAAAHTKELAHYHYDGHGGNLPAAYLTGLLAGTRMKGKAESVIVDLGVQPAILGTRLFAAVKGIQDAGVNVHVPEKSGSCCALARAASVATATAVRTCFSRFIRRLASGRTIW